MESMYVCMYITEVINIIASQKELLKKPLNIDNDSRQSYVMTHL